MLMINLKNIYKYYNLIKFTLKFYTNIWRKITLEIN